MHHITIAFYGDFRPVHFEAETVGDCAKQVRKACTDQEIIARMDSLLKTWKRYRKAGISCTSICSEYGGASVSLLEGKRDTWLDSITEKMPLNPQIKYL